MGDWLSALSRIYLASPTASYLAVVEDDVALCWGLFDYLAKSIPEDDIQTEGRAAFWSPYCPGVYMRMSPKFTWFDVEAGSRMVGACFIVFPRRSVEMILQDADVYRWAVEGKPIDAYLGRWAKAVSRVPRYHSPSLVQHIGLKPSDDIKTTLRQAADFIGVGVSAVDASATPSVRVATVEPGRNDAPEVSIVIAGRNSAEWIEEAIASALNQSVKCEVIFSDDASTDATLAVASMYENLGLIVLESAQHAGVVAARNRGAATARGKYLCHLDADDTMPSDYIASHLSAMVEGCPFVYGAVIGTGVGQHVGHVWNARDFEAWDRWGHNTVNTSALYRRDVFFAAGGWRETGSMWDYDLALRALRVSDNAPRVSPAVLNYRQHEKSWSHTLDERRLGHAAIAEGIHRLNARLSVGTLLSGRLPGLFPAWIEALSQSVRFAGLEHKPDLVVLYDKGAAGMMPEARTIAARFAEPFASIRFEAMRHDIGDYGGDEVVRRNVVAEHLAIASDQLRQTVNGDALWIVEDDIIVPLNAGRELWGTLVSRSVPPEVVSGLYRNRHVHSKFVGGWVTDKGYEEPSDIGKHGQDVIEAHFVGCGCLMLWLSRPQMPKFWRSHYSAKDTEVPAHDWAFCQDVLGNGGVVLWNLRVKCGHAVGVNAIINC
jgi:hypothetical protein